MYSKNKQVSLVVSIFLNRTVLLLYSDNGLNNTPPSVTRHGLAVSKAEYFPSELVCLNLQGSAFFPRLLRHYTA